MSDNETAEYLRELADEAPGNYRDGLLKAADVIEAGIPTGGAS